MSMIIEAVRFAFDAHEGQVRKYTGTPYIHHPLRVMGKTMAHKDCTEAMACAAVLHDTVEDCGAMLSTLEDSFTPTVARLVYELTNRSKLEYPETNREMRKRVDRARIATISREAKIIKLIDRIDNLKEIPPGVRFFEVYATESRLLLGVLCGTDAGLESEMEALFRSQP